MASVHILGEITGAVILLHDVPAHSFWRMSSSQALWCKWELVVEDNGRWVKSDGARDHKAPEEPASKDPDNSDGEADWAHPIDVHYITTSVRGWPRLVVEVWAQDRAGRNELAGYGVASVPCAPGNYQLAISLWRPVDLANSRTRFLADPLGFIGQSMSGLLRATNGVFLGVWPRLHSDLNPTGASEMTNAKKLIYYPPDHTTDRRVLRTVGTGVVSAKLCIVTRGFSKLGPGINPQVEVEWEEEQRRKASEKDLERTMSRS